MKSLAACIIVLLAATSCASATSDGVVEADSQPELAVEDQERPQPTATNEPARAAQVPDPDPTTAPNVEPSAIPAVPDPTATATVPSCDVTTSRPFDLQRDLISLHYDHAPDQDDGHAAASAKDVALALGFTPWVVSGAYGVENAQGYNEGAEPVMEAVWGPDWVNAHADWDAAVAQTADAWEHTLERCGDIWIAEGGQSDFSSDVVRELQVRMPEVVTTQRIHVVQHSSFNATYTNDTDLDYVSLQTDYIFIGDGNRGGNGTANLNELGYSGPFVEQALNGANAAGWEAAFEYYSPQTRVDFSDTVELLHIVGIGTDVVADIDDFGDEFVG